jgi:mono/diheme cytochrome c family protein
VTTLERLVNGVQVATLVVAAAFVLLLFVNEPAKPAPIPAVGTDQTGAAVYSTRCASCHGADGGGGFGPALGNGIVAGRYPDPVDQAAVIADGRGAMPGFAGGLTTEQIAAVVTFTRTELG